MTLALVQQRSALAEVLDVAPAALGNLARAYNPDFGTLDTRDNGLGARERRGRRLRRAGPGWAGVTELDLPGADADAAGRRCRPRPSRSAPGCCPATPNADGVPTT